MAGNERRIAEYLFDRINMLELAHLGIVSKISIPFHGHISELSTKHDLLQLTTEDSSKKADIYINDRGVSLKQSGSYFLFNRLQRADLLSVFSTLGFGDSNNILSTLDAAVDNFHYRRIKGRSRPWHEIFEKTYFYRLLKFLMMEGSPHSGLSAHPADLILQAPPSDITDSNIQVFTFDEYFSTFQGRFEIAIRRSWIGQSSNGEHYRAVGLAKKPENAKWIYESISGSPRPSQRTNQIWRDDVLPSDRRTVYHVSIQKS
jgi:hypothetical protein